MRYVYGDAEYGIHVGIMTCKYSCTLGRQVR